MNKMMQEVQKVIDKAGIDGALSKDAIALFHATIEENKELKEKKDQYEKWWSDGSAENNKLQYQIKELTKEVEDWEARALTLAKREDAMTRLELEAKHQAQRVNDHQEMVGLIFRNTELKRETHTSKSVPVLDQYGSMTTQYENEDKDESEIQG